MIELMWVDPSCISAITDAGLTEIVLCSMRRHGTVSQLQQMACGFFRAMSYDFANHRYIEHTDGVRAVIDAMKRNMEPKKYEILKEGCYFLQNILCNADITAETIELIVTSGIVTLMVTMMHAKSDNAEYLEASCGVLANLAIDERARVHIGNCASSLPALLAVLDPAFDPVMYTNACKCALNAVTLIATGNEENKAKIGKLGAVKTVVDFLHTPGNVALLGAGMSLLTELTKSNKDNAQLLIDAGGYEFVISEMEKHKECPNIQATCCGVLRNLPKNSVEQADGAVKRVLSAMQFHKEDKMVQFEACHALIQYCAHFPAIAESMQSKASFQFESDARVLKRKRVPSSKCHDPGPNLGIPSKEEGEVNGDDGDQRSRDHSLNINAIVKMKPLKDDIIGEKVRKVIVKAVKNRDNPKTQDKACEILRSMATSVENVSKIIDLGGLDMVSIVSHIACYLGNPNFGSLISSNRLL